MCHTHALTHSFDSHGCCISVTMRYEWDTSTTSSTQHHLSQTVVLSLRQHLRNAAVPNSIAFVRVAWFMHRTICRAAPHNRQTDKFSPSHLVSLRLFFCFRSLVLAASLVRSISWGCEIDLILSSLFFPFFLVLSLLLVGAFSSVKIYFDLFMGVYNTLQSHIQNNRRLCRPRRRARISREWSLSILFTCSFCLFSLAWQLSQLNSTPENLSYFRCTEAGRGEHGGPDQTGLESVLMMDCVINKCMSNYTSSNKQFDRSHPFIHSEAHSHAQPEHIFHY